MCVIHQMASQVYIGPFFLCFDYPHISRCERILPRHRHGNVVSKKVAEYNRQVGNCSQGAKVDFLSDRLIGIGRSGLYPGSEILDLIDSVMAWR